MLTGRLIMRWTLILGMLVAEPGVDMSVVEAAVQFSHDFVAVEQECFGAETLVEDRPRAIGKRRGRIEVICDLEVSVLEGAVNALAVAAARPVNELITVERQGAWGMLYVDR